MSLLVLLLAYHAVTADGSTCSGLQPNTDVQYPVRSIEYPNGLSFVNNVTGCCTICDATPDCLAFVYQPSARMCYPLASYSSLITKGVTDRVFGGSPPPPPSPPPSAWAAKIRAYDMLYSPSDLGVDPSHMPMIGNGFMATQVMSSDLWVAGLFNGYLTKDPSHRARLPSTVAIAAPGVPGPCALDIREATYLRRSYLDPSPPGTCTAASTRSCSNAPARVWVEQRWYAHRSRPSVLVHEVQVLPDATAAVVVSATTADPYVMLSLVNHPGGDSNDLALSPSPSAPPGTSLLCGSTKVAESNSSGLQSLCILATLLPPMALVPSDAPHATLTFLTVVRTSVETTGGEGLEAAALADYAGAMLVAGSGGLHAEHVDEWQGTVWAAGFETDRADLALAVNSSLYAILSSVRNDRPFGLSPGGLTSGYNGHSFWDCETWMFPGILLLHPDTALTLLDYRTARLAGARDKARSYTPPFSGAMFPWESAYTGEETCPTWAPTGLREVHINGDITHAVWALWRGLQDNGAGFLDTTAWPLLEGIAQWWMSKLDIDNPGAGPGDPLSLLNVIPPDEYADHKNNSAFTNHGAIESLMHASAVSELLGLGRVAQWEDAAARIVRPHNASGDWTPEFEGYVNGTIKQADVVLLGFPLEADWVGATTRANNLQRYSVVTDSGGPAMTWGMHAVGYIELGAGFEALAAQNFNRSFANAQLPFLVWTETPSGGTPNFLTGAGGFLQTAFQGYTGLRVTDTAISFAPMHLPEGAGMVKLRGIAYLGARVDFEYNATAVWVSVQGVDVVERVGEGGGRGSGTGTPSCPLCMSPGGSRGLWESRQQVGRVVMGGGRWVVQQRALEVVDSQGTTYDLVPGGGAVVLPIQKFTVQQKQ